MKQNSIVKWSGWQNMLFFMLMFLTAPLAVSKEMQAGKEMHTFTGVFSTYAEEDDGVITEVELEADTVDGKVYYSILLDEKTKKLIKKFENVEVEVKGTLVSKEDEEWLSIVSCMNVLTGTVRSTKDGDKGFKSIQLQCDGKRTFEIPICDRSRECATKMEGKMIRAVGLIQFKNNMNMFELNDYLELIAGKGHLEIDQDAEEKVLAIRFALVDQKGEVIQRYNIKVDDAGRELAENYEEETIELSGTLLVEGGKTWLTVLKCDFSVDEEDEEELEVEIDDGGGRDG
jgi:hypothetical protein